MRSKAAINWRVFRHKTNSTDIYAELAHNYKEIRESIWNQK